MNNIMSRHLDDANSMFDGNRLIESGSVPSPIFLAFSRTLNHYGDGSRSLLVSIHSVAEDDTLGVKMSSYELFHCVGIDFPHFNQKKMGLKVDSHAPDFEQQWAKFVLLYRNWLRRLHRMHNPNPQYRYLRGSAPIHLYGELRTLYTLSVEKGGRHG